MTVEEQVKRTSKAVRATETGTEGVVKTKRHKDVVFPDEQVAWLELQKAPMAATSLGEVVRRFVRFVKTLRDMLKEHPNALILVYDPDANDEVLLKLRLDSATG